MRVTTSHIGPRDVHPHSQNHHKLSSLSIWPDPVPLVRLLLTHMIPDKPVRCEASVRSGEHATMPQRTLRHAWASGTPAKVWMGLY